MSDGRGWIGVDLDGTLARYDGWGGIDAIGPPVPEMVERVRGWVGRGEDVRIFTARVGPQRFDVEVTAERIAEIIQEWCVEHLGFALPVTCQKDFGMIELWDDRCVQVEANTGRRMDGAEG